MIFTLLFNKWSLFLILSVISLFCLYEYFILVKRKSSPEPVSLFFSAVVVLITFHLVQFDLIHSDYFLIYFLIPVILFLTEVFRKNEIPFLNIAINITGIIYCVLPFIILMAISDSHTYPFDGKWFVLLIFLTIWANDTFAYVFGRLFGKHKLAPHISAGKTIEGSIGGILMSVIPLILYFYYFDIESSQYYKYIFLALLISILSIISDLTESKLKRMVDVKDSGKLLPGHGGFLDRFDSVLITTPVIFVYIKIIL